MSAAPTWERCGGGGCPVNGEPSQEICKAEDAQRCPTFSHCVVCLNFIISTSLVPATSYSQSIKASGDVTQGVQPAAPCGSGESWLWAVVSRCISAAAREDQHRGGMSWGCAAHYYVREAFSFKCTAIAMNLNKTLKGISCRKLMPGEPIVNTTCPNPSSAKQ